MAAGFPVKEDYANGDVLTATNLNDLAGTVNLIQAPLGNAAGKNKLINSNFSVWQRGTSFTGTGNYYTADRWQGYRGATAAGATFSRQSAALDGFQYSLQAQRDSGNAALNAIFVAQSFETDVTRQFQGKKITVSFWAKAGANFSSGSSNLGVNIVTGTGTETRITAGFTSQTSTALTGATLTTSWQRFTLTSAAVIPTTATQFALQFAYTPTGTAGAADNFEITGVQLEVGEITTGWSLAGGTIQGELAACQRYYYRQTYAAAGDRTAVGFAANTALAYIVFPFPVTMRTAPTALEQSGTGTDYSVNTAAGLITCNAVPTFFVGNPQAATVNLNFAAAALVAGTPAIFRNATTNAYLGWSAEL